MIALLLNSGRGTRMGAETQEHPKCMCRLDGEDTIISWQVKLLKRIGVKEAVVTTGPFADMLREHLASLDSGITFHYVPNPDYMTTNYIVSMDNARELLMGDDVISLHGDLVLHPQVMDMLAAAPVSSVAVDASLPLPEKDFKAHVVNGQVRAIGVNVFGAGCVASQPAYKFLRRDFGRWMEEIRRFVQQGHRTCYAEEAFNAAWVDIPLYPLDVGGRLCAEIDNPEDQARVCAAFLATVRSQT
ncbi:MAG: NTP transferase domain-containing protein [Aristaeellaceae bacterium]